ncbi:ATP-dependent nuclease [Streptomyces sp. NPDC087263]|uniref:ATP-dependent nuclease n=1 Tax=Streptomyces sp. NPDC087263 TaxID=3365773 RepID=UPI00382CA5E4
MRLVELSVSNFRSLGHVESIPIHKQTILTGHNDCGKTATLDAIAVLLGERSIIDSDISDFAEAEPVRAALPADQDEEQRTVTVEGRFALSAAEEKSLGTGPFLRVRRRYVEGGRSCLEWLTEVPRNPALRDITPLKAGELRDLASELGLKLAEGKPNVKDSWAELLKEHAAGTDDKVTDWVVAPEAVASALPQLLYFKGEAAESPEAVVRSILTAKLREYTLREETRKKVTDLEEEFAALLKDDVVRLQKLVEERCAFDAFTVEPGVQFRPTVNSLSLTAAAPGQRAVSLTAAGSGRSRRVSLALWEASQELLSENSDDSPGVIIAYDEPDTHLDYDHQRRIMQMIKVSASAEQSTVIVATHSLNLIDGVDIQDIVHLNSRDGRAYVQSLGAEDSDEDTRRFMSNMAVSLGFRNSVLLHERCFVGVEGPTEYAALPALFKLAFGYPIQSAGIALWDCGGNDGALNFAKFLKKHKRTVMFLVDGDSIRDKEKEFSLNRLEKYGFTEKDCLFLGDPNELEDVFSDDQWADTMNAEWPRKDEQQWTPKDVADLRRTGKFSKSLHSLLYQHSEQAPRKKESMVVELAQRLRQPSDVPPALVKSFNDAIKVASEAGLRHWSEDE